MTLCLQKVKEYLDIAVKSAEEIVKIINGKKKKVIKNQVILSNLK